VESVQHYQSPRFLKDLGILVIVDQKVQSLMIGFQVMVGFLVGFGVFVVVWVLVDCLLVLVPDFVVLDQ
jgi:hypothetical protein